MIDLRTEKSPTDARLNLRNIGTTIQSQVTGDVFQTNYTRKLWSGQYSWRVGNQSQMESLEVMLNSDNIVLQIPLQVFGSDTTYTGTMSDWSFDDGVWTFSGTQTFKVGQHIQFGRYCMKVKSVMNNDYTFLNELAPDNRNDLTNNIVATTASFYIEGTNITPLDRRLIVTPRHKITDIFLDWIERL